MFERLNTRWILAGVAVLVLGLVSVACMQFAPRVLPSLSSIPGLNLNAAAPDDATIAPDTAVLVNPNGSAAAAKPGPGQALVARGPIAEMINLTGRVAGADETVITFPASGVVHAVDVKLGDTVQQGDVLIESDAQDIKKQLIQAQGELETASIRFDQARAQADADAANQQSNSTQRTRDSAAQRQAVVSDAQAALHRAQASLEKVQAGPLDSDVRAAQAAVTTAQSATQRAEADLARQQRGADPAQVRTAQTQVDIAQADVQRAQATLDTLTKGADPNLVRGAQRDVDRTSAVLRAAQVIPIDPKDPHIEKTRADKDAAIASAQGDLQAAQDRLNTLNQPPNATDVAVATGTLQVAKAKLDAGKQALSDATAGPDQSSIDQAQALVDNAHLSQQNAEDHLAEVMSHPTLPELQAAQDQVKAAQGAIDRANAIGANLDATGANGGIGTAYNLVLLEKDVARNQALLDSLQEDLTASLLTAPFTGIVTNIQVNVGDKLTKDIPAVTLAKRGEAVVRLDLTNADAAKVAVAQTASVTLDTTTTPFDAKVAAMKDPPKGQAGRVSLISVDWQAEAPPYGTVVKVQIQVNHKDNVLLVPKKAVHTAGQRRYVQVQSGTGRKIANVEVGIISTDSAEITSGLTEGQIVYVGP